MITCQRCEELINARLDGDLTEQDALLLEEHLAQCPACRKLDQDLTTLHEGLKQLSFDPPEGLSAAVLAQLDPIAAQSAAKRKKKPWPVLACAAAAVVLMAAALFPQVLPFGGSAGDTAAAETTEAAEPPEAADTASDAAPAEGASPTTELAEEEKRVESQLTQKQAQKLLEDYLDQDGRFLSITPVSLSEDGSCWSFTARDPDSGERFSFSVYCADGYVEEIPLP